MIVAGVGSAFLVARSEPSSYVVRALAELPPPPNQARARARVRARRELAARHVLIRVVDLAVARYAVARTDTHDPRAGRKRVHAGVVDYVDAGSARRSTPASLGVQVAVQRVAAPTPWRDAAVALPLALLVAYAVGIALESLDRRSPGSRHGTALRDRLQE